MILYRVFLLDKMEAGTVCCQHYEVAVIGSGLMGSAAAKYVSKENVQSCVLIGPQQPQDGIYGAWFDSGRIAEVLDQNSNWMELGIFRIRDTPKSQYR